MVVGGPLLFVVVLARVLGCSRAGPVRSTDDAPLVFLSLDGFRWDYLDHYGQFLPNFLAIRAGGSTVQQGLMNAFITKTFPNHRTLVTGQWEETHGIVANHFWDPVYQEQFGMGTSDVKFWNNSLPIWRVAQDQGVTSGVFLYPGSDVVEQQPKYTLGLPYSDYYPFPSMVDNATAALNDPDDPAKFVVMYFHEPDHTGHLFGPWSKEMLATLMALDEYMGYMMTQFGPGVNYVITSDHGMNQLRHNLNATELTEALTPFTNHVFNNRVQLFIWPKEDELSELNVAAILADYQQVYPAVEIYRKPEMLDRWHYRDNRRTAPIMILAPLNYQFSDDGYYLQGNHGYDNLDHAMHPFFLAYGPAFKSGYVVQSEVFSIDIYPLLCDLLDIVPADNNGTLSRISEILV